MKSFLTLCCAFLAFAEAVFATVIYVPGQYATIQAGVNAAQNGDTVLVAAGTYTESVTIQNAVIHLLSSGGPDVTTIQLTISGNYSVLKIYNGSEISGFRLYRYAALYSGPDVIVFGGNPYIHHNVILMAAAEGCTGVQILSGSPLFLNNTIWLWDENADYMYGFQVTSAAATPTIKNNIVKEALHWNSISYGIFNQDGANINHSYNDYYQCSLRGTPQGAGEIFADPVLSGNYHLLAGSPCIDTGVPELMDPDSSRSDMGCFYYPQPMIAPIITSTPDTIAYAGLPYNYQLEYTASPAPVFQLLIAPEGMTVSYYGNLHWDVPASFLGDTVVSVKASNPLGWDIQTYSMHVLPNTLQPPQIISYSPVVLDTLAYRQIVQFTVQATDPNGFTLEYQWKLNGVNISQDSTCDITFLQLGQNDLWLWVSNGYQQDSVSWHPFIPGQYVSGNVNGVWSAAASPYVATNSLTVPAGQTLNMMPGTILYLGANMTLTTAGTLHAQGILNDSVYFRNDGNVSFGGLVCSGGAGSAILSYCVIDSASTGLYGSYNHLTKIEHSRLRVGSLGVKSQNTDSTLVANCNVQATLVGVQVNSGNYARINNNVLWTRCTTGLPPTPSPGIYFMSSNCDADSNRIYSENTTTQGCDGIWVWGGQNISLSHNQIEVNGDVNYIGGIYLVEGAVVTAVNNSIRLLHNGRGFDLESSTITALNNIIYGSGGVAATSSNPGNQSQISYNDFYGFDSLYHNVQGGLGNLSINPQFIGGDPFSYQLQVNSPCIDTGDPASPLDPDGTRADMGAYYFDQGVPTPISITLSPLAPPIVVPANGGSFNFLVSVIRISAPQTPFAVWARIRKPNGTWTPPTLGPVNINPPINVTISRQRTQNVPAEWPAGDYLYVGYCAAAYPGEIIDSSYFPWSKSATADGGPMLSDATCTGDPFPYEVTGETYLPSAVILNGASPNPFNPTTEIRFQMPEARNVSLRVYDTAGRLVTTLVDGWRDAGAHTVTFDGSKLASGLYFVQMQAREYHAVQKLMLLK